MHTDTINVGSKEEKQAQIIFFTMKCSDSCVKRKSCSTLEHWMHMALGLPDTLVNAN